jgi:hypothetical protein
MLIDHERVLLLLKQEISAKPSHGQRDLLAAIARLEGECALDEPLMERHLRLLVAATRDHLEPADGGPRVDRRDGADDTARAASGSTVRQETPHGSSRDGSAAALAACA